MPLQDFVNVVISTQANRATGPGFGIPLILSHSATWTERVRSYSSLSAVAVDFATTTPEYLMAAAIFSQDPSPPKIKIGRCANKPTPRWAATPVAVDGATYKGTLVGTDRVEHPVTYVAGTMLDLPFTGQTVNFTAGLTVTGGSSGAKAIILSIQADAGATGTIRVVGVRGTFTNGEALSDTGGGNGTLGTQAAVTGVAASVPEIVNGLRSKLDALGLGVTNSDQTTYLRILSNTAGAFFSFYVDDERKLGLAMDQADPGLAADLDEILKEDKDWWLILEPFPSAATVAAIAAWAEANERYYLTVTQDSEVIQHVPTSATDVMGALKTSGYMRTGPLYKRLAHKFADAAWAGAVLPLVSGSEEWGKKTLAGIDADNLTDTQIANVKGKNGNVYTTVAGINVTQDGHSSSGEWIDVVRFRDWLASDMQLRIFGHMASVPKIPFTDPGIAMIQADVLASLKTGVDVGGLSGDPDDAPTCTVPRARDVSAASRAARTLTGVQWTARLAGAIVAVDPLNGILVV